MKIGAPKNKPEFKLGSMKIVYSDCYKYLGLLLNTNNNLEDHIKSTKGKAEAAYQTTLSIAGNSNMKNIEMRTIWELISCCIQPTITYSSEVWQPTKSEQTRINRIMDNIIKRTLMVPQSTPREALYIETGLLDPETICAKNRIMMEHRLANSNPRMNRLTDTSQEKSWRETTDAIKNKASIEREDMQGEKLTVKKKVGQKINSMFKNKIDGEGRDKSKIKHLLEGIREWTPQVRQPYMDRLTRTQVSHIFKARTRMLDIKNNFRGKYENLTCGACKNAPETQQHILEECPNIHINDEYIVKKDDVFGTEKQS